MILQMIARWLREGVGRPAPDDGDPERSPRQLMLFLDGTGNSITGGERDTNVLKLYQSLLMFAEENGRDDLRLYYDPGVGSPDQLPATGLTDQLHRTWERVIGLAEGGGIFENVSNGYAFLMRHYEPGDAIFIFGFSRGAFTARAIAGLVNLVGVMNEDSEQLLPLLARVYFSASDAPVQKTAAASFVRGVKRRLAPSRGKSRRAPGDRSPDEPPTRKQLADQIKRDFTSRDRQDARVYFLGVWDTVDSVGLPGFSKSITSPPTARDKPGLVHVRQALSLDEHRAAFRPRVYVEPDYDIVDAAGVRRSLRQRWFPGAHSDVGGGGYPVDEGGLAQGTFGWIVREALDVGLARRSVDASASDRSAERAEADERAWRGLAREIERRAATAASARRRHDEIVETPWWALVGMTLRVPGPIGSTETTPYVVPDAASRPITPFPVLFAIAGIVVASLAAIASAGSLLALFEAVGDRAAWHDAVHGALATLGAYANGLAHVVRFDFGEVAPTSNGFEAFRRHLVFVPWERWKALSAPAGFAWLLLSEMLLAISIGYLLAIATGRAFVRWAGAAAPGNRPSAWKVVGTAPAFAILGWCAKNVAWLLALLCGVAGLKAIAFLFFVAGVVALFAALVGWIGCAVLVAMGLLRWPRAWSPVPPGA